MISPVVKLMHFLYNEFYTPLVCNKLAEFKVHMNLPEAMSISIKYHSVGII